MQIVALEFNILRPVSFVKINFEYNNLTDQVFFSRALFVCTIHEYVHLLFIPHYTIVFFELPY